MEHLQFLLWKKNIIECALATPIFFYNFAYHCWVISMFLKSALRAPESHLSYLRSRGGRAMFPPNYLT